MKELGLFSLGTNLERPYSGLQGEEMGRDSLSEINDSMISDSFKQKNRKTFTLDIRKKILYSEGGEALEHVAQRSCGLPIPRGVQSQVGWDPGKSDVVGRNPAHGRNWMILKIFSNPNHSTSLYDSMIL